MKKIVLKLLYVFAVICIVLSKEVYGYLDPSAMTYMIQVAAAIGITIATGFGVFIYKIKRFFKNKKNKAIDKKETSETVEKVEEEK